MITTCCPIVSADEVRTPEEMRKIWKSPEMIEIIRKWTPISVLIKPNNYNNYKNDKNNQTNV